MTPINKKIVILVMLFSLVVVGIGGYYIVSALNDNNTSGPKVTQKNEYFSIRNNATAYQKELYDALIAAMKQSIDSQEVATLIVQNYVADYYTWSNKLKFNDVGGLQFIHPSIRGWFNALSLDTFYNNMAYYIDQGSLKESLEVTQVSVTQVQETTVTLEDGTLVDGLMMDASWQYASSSLLNTEDYQNESSFTLIKDEKGVYAIVKGTDHETDME